MLISEQEAMQREVAELRAQVAHLQAREVDLPALKERIQAAMMVLTEPPQEGRKRMGQRDRWRLINILTGQPEQGT